MPQPKKCRISKWLAERTSFSRRQIEEHILEGRVSVNGTTLDSPIFFVEAHHKVKLDQVLIPQAKELPRIWLYYKPAGCLVTRDDPQGRPTIFDKLPAAYRNLLYVGRLDFNTEGLLILTNSGEVVQGLSHPGNEFLRHYLVRAFGTLEENTLEKLAQGVEIGHKSYKPVKISLEKEGGNNPWFSITLKEGRNREIHRLMEFYGFKISRLIRTSFGEFKLDNMEKEEIKEAL